MCVSTVWLQGEVRGKFLHTFTNKHTDVVCSKGSYLHCWKSFEKLSEVLVDFDLNIRLCSVSVWSTEHFLAEKLLQGICVFAYPVHDNYNTYRARTVSAPRSLKCYAYCPVKVYIRYHTLEGLSYSPSR